MSYLVSPDSLKSLDIDENTLETLNNTPAAEQVVDWMEVLVGDGTIGVLTGILDNTYDETGFLSNPTFKVTYESYNLDLLPENTLGIVVETFPYTRTFASNNDYISNYSTVSDFSEPSITQIVETAGSAFSDGSGTYVTSDDTYNVVYSTEELQGLRDRFSGPESITTKTYVNDAINSLILQAYEVSTTKQTIFKSMPSTRINPRNISSRSDLGRRPQMNTQNTGSAELANTGMMTSPTSQTGY